MISQIALDLISSLRLLAVVGCFFDGCGLLLGDVGRRAMFCITHDRLSGLAYSMSCWEDHDSTSGGESKVISLKDAVEAQEKTEEPVPIPRVWTSMMGAIDIKDPVIEQFQPLGRTPSSSANKTCSNYRWKLVQGYTLAWKMVASTGIEVGHGDGSNLI